MTLLKRHLLLSRDISPKGPYIFKGGRVKNWPNLPTDISSKKHLEIMKRLDYQTLLHCKEVNRLFKEFMKEETLSSREMIKHCTDCSDELMFDVIEKRSLAFILSSFLKEIFQKF